MGSKEVEVDRSGLRVGVGFVNIKKSFEMSFALVKAKNSSTSSGKIVASLSKATWHRRYISDSPVFLALELLQKKRQAFYLFLWSYCRNSG